MQRARTEIAKNQRREALLDAALDEFFESGFGAARMDRIAKRAGVSKGTIYIYFESKEQLFESIVKSVGMRNADQLVQVVRAAPNAMSAIAAIADHAPVLIQQTKLPRLMKVLIEAGPMFPDLTRRYREQVVDKVLGALADIFLSAHERGEILAPEPHLAARLLVAPVAFSSMWQIMFEADAKAKVDLEKLFKLHAQMFMRAVKVPENGQ